MEGREKPQVQAHPSAVLGLAPGPSVGGVRGQFHLGLHPIVVVGLQAHLVPEGPLVPQPGVPFESPTRVLTERCLEDVSDPHPGLAVLLTLTASPLPIQKSENSARDETSS